MDFLASRSSSARRWLWEIIPNLWTTATRSMGMMVIQEKYKHNHSRLDNRTGFETRSILFVLLQEIHKKPTFFSLRNIKHDFKIIFLVFKVEHFVQITFVRHFVGCHGNGFWAHSFNYLKTADCSFRFRTDVMRKLYKDRTHFEVL